MTPSTPLLLIRAGRREDQSAILALIAEIFGQEEAERASRRWDWQWHEDPRLKTPGYSGVVAEWEGQLVAAIGCIPAGLYLEGVPVEAFWFADALAHWGLIRKAMRAARKAVVAALQRLKFKERFKEGKSMSTLVRRIEADELYITRGDGDGG